MTGVSTGIRGDALGSLAGVEKFGANATTSDQAKAILEKMNTHFGNRNGTLRILHTTANKEMKFESTGGLKRIFLNEDRLAKAGQAVENLMRKAGYPEDLITRFKGYRAQRGERGLEVRKVMEFIREGFSHAGLVAHGADELSALRNFGCPEPSGDLLGKGGYGTVQSISHGNREAVYKKLHSGQALETEQNTIPARAGKLARKGDVVVNWMKDDIPHVIKPSALVVKQIPANGRGPAAYHTVPAGKFFKNWAADQLNSSRDRFEIVGLLMPRAPGEELLSESGGNAGTYGPQALARLAKTGLETITATARHGFVLGDIKPGNIMTDGQQFNFIDLGSMQKVSKDGGVSAPEAATVRYLIPTAGGKEGFEEDLYAFGLTLAETYLTSQQQQDLAKAITSVGIGDAAFSRDQQSAAFVRIRKQEVKRQEALKKAPESRTPEDERLIAAGSPLMSEVRRRLGTHPVPRDSALDFGLQCMEAALNHNPKQVTRFDPATAGPDHPLVKLAQHSIITGQPAPDQAA